MRINSIICVGITILNDMNSVIVCLDFYTGRLGDLQTTNLFFSVQESRSKRSRSQHGQILMKALCVLQTADLTVSSQGKRQTSSLQPLL